MNISDSEIIILIYLLNSDISFNPKQISKDLGFQLNETMELINSLVEKGLLKIDIVNKKVREEIINLDELYKKLSFLIVNGEDQEVKNNIYDKFESRES